MRLSRPIVAVLAALALVAAALSPQPAAAVDIYITEGTHSVNGREWRTTCEPYSQTQRCRTEITATVVTYQDGRFITNTGWAFNNLTYAASARTLWTANPLGAFGKVGGTATWTGTDGRNWRTECDTAATGRGGCRSYAEADIIESYTTPDGGTAHRWVTRWLFNNMVRFTATSPTTPRPTPTTTATPIPSPEPTRTPTPGPTDPPEGIVDAALQECVDDAVADFGSIAEIEYLLCDGLDITTLDGLPTMAALDMLSLNDNRITSLDGLVTQPNLTWLSLGGNGLTSLQGLPELPMLQTLEAWSNSLRGVIDARTLPATVTTLSLDDNALTGFTGAGTNLMDVNLASNQLTSIAGLVGATNLTSLDLFDNRVTSVAGLAGLTKLQALYLEDNAITDLATLQPLVDNGCFVDIWQ